MFEGCLDCNEGGFFNWMLEEGCSAFNAVAEAAGKLLLEGIKSRTP